jgi:hypothetical protein
MLTTLGQGNQQLSETIETITSHGRNRKDWSQHGEFVLDRLDIVLGTKVKGLETNIGRSEQSVNFVFGILKDMRRAAIRLQVKDKKNESSGQQLNGISTTLQTNTLLLIPTLVMTTTTGIPDVTQRVR